MSTIWINIDCKDSFGTDKHFCTVVGSVDEVHGALMDCLREIRNVGWCYLEHTITIYGSTEGEENESFNSKCS